MQRVSHKIIYSTNLLKNADLFSNTTILLYTETERIYSDKYSVLT